MAYKAMNWNVGEVIEEGNEQEESHHRGNYLVQIGIGAQTKERD